MTDKPLRFCVDCRHYREEESQSMSRDGRVQKWPEWRCAREFDLPPDLVTGHVMRRYGGNPRTMRTTGECGPEGLLWEGKE